VIEKTGHRCPSSGLNGSPGELRSALDFLLWPERPEVMPIPAATSMNLLLTALPAPTISRRTELVAPRGRAP